MKKFLTAAVPLVVSLALLLMGMYVYSKPDIRNSEPLVTRNIIVESIEIESHGGSSFYVLRDKHGSEYIFTRLPELMGGGNCVGRSAQVKCTPADSSGRRYLRELTIDGEVFISNDEHGGGSSPQMAHIAGAVIVTMGFIALWIFVRNVIRLASANKKDG